MAADHAADQPGMAQMVKAAMLSIALSRGIDEGEVARPAAGLRRRRRSREKQLLQRDGDALGKAYADETTRRHGVAVADQAHGIHRRDHLAAVPGAQGYEKRMRLFLLHRYCLPPAHRNQHKLQHRTGVALYIPAANTISLQCRGRWPRPTF